MSRRFVYDDREFEDPDPDLEVDQVRDMMSATFSELVNATHETVKRGDDDIITFKRTVGTKG